VKRESRPALPSSSTGLIDVTTLHCLVMRLGGAGCSSARARAFTRTSTGSAAGGGGGRRRSAGESERPPIFILCIIVPLPLLSARSPRLDLGDS
jgi:hypothetical protein